jgi:ABC-type transport system involved in multi-copper enzyme maturation permease subunit
VNGTLAVARYTLLELTRRRILIVFVGVGAGGLVLVATLLKVFSTVFTGSVRFGSGTNGPDPATLARALQLGFVSDIISVLGIFALLIAFAIGMTVIYHDLESGAAISIFSKPVSRFAFAAGKVTAAVTAMVVIVGVLGLESRLLMLLFGDTAGLDTALWLEIVAQVGNALTLMLLVMALSTWMNNIVAAVVAFIYNAVAGIVVALHTQDVAGQLGNNWVVSDALKVLYWLVPHALISDAPREIAKAEFALVAASSSGQGQGGPTTDQLLSGIPSASAFTDIVWWAFVVVVFASLVYLAVRRRQV